MKKIIIVLSMCMALILALTSCDGLFNNNQNNEPEATEYTQIVYADESLNLSEVATKMRALVGPRVKIGLYSDVTPGDGEVVFGDSDRAVTAAARAELEKLLAEDSENDCGYIIYCDGKNIAVYWQLEGMEDIAIQKFLSVCIDEKELKLESGAVDGEYYAKRDFEKEKHWLALEAVASDEVVRALKSLYTYYDGEKIVDWMANLYDPVAGGFYYSRSARDNEPFRADVESTRQATQLIVSSGGLKSRNDLPADIKAKILEFTLNLQSPNDGYFYHPQWAQDKSQLNTDRYGRDISSALGIINDLNLDVDGDGIEDDIYPLYCAPNGKKCAKHINTDDKCAFPLDKISASDVLGTSVSAAVSRVTDSYVKATAVSSHPDYSSRKAFSDWLEEYNASIKEDSGKAHNLSAIAGEIAAHGYTDIVVDHLKRVQAEVYEEQLANDEEPTGLWQRNVNYRAVWGLLKYASYYNSDYAGAMDMKYIPHIVNTCIKVIAMPIEGAYYANDIYNMWQALMRIMNHVKAYYGAGALDDIYEQVRESAPDLIRHSISKLEPFKRTDGSFSYSTTGISSTSIYGTPISMGDVEGDMNAVSLCCQMYEAIYTVLGYKQVPLFSPSDGERFIKILRECDPISKEKVKAEVMDFEGDTLPDNLSVKMNGTGAGCVIAEDPEDSANNALHFKATPISGSGSNVLSVSPYKTGAGCYLMDMDMYVASEGTDDTYSFQIYYGDAYMIAFKKTANGVELYADKTGGGVFGQKLTTLPLDEWFRLTVECYMPNEENPEITVPKLRVWVDGIFIAESEDYLDQYSTGTYTDTFALVKFWSMKKRNTEMYFDNLYIATVDRDYDESDTTFVDIREE